MQCSLWHCCEFFSFFHSSDPSISCIHSTSFILWYAQYDWIKEIICEHSKITPDMCNENNHDDIPNQPSNKSSLLASDEPSTLPLIELSLLPSDEPSLLPYGEPSVMPSNVPSLLPQDEIFSDNDNFSLEAAKPTQVRPQIES